MTTLNDFAALESSVVEKSSPEATWKRAGQWTTKNLRGIVVSTVMAALGAGTAVALHDNNSNARHIAALTSTAEDVLKIVGNDHRRIDNLIETLQGVSRMTNGNATGIDGLTATLRGVSQDTSGNGHRIDDLASTLQGVAQVANGDASRIEDLARTAQDIMQKINLAALVKEVSPSVFKVAVYDKDKDFGSGSAFLVEIANDRGYIVTDAHVASEEDSSIYLIRNDGISIKADLIGSDPKTDLSVLQVPSDFIKGIKPLAWGETPEVGDEVIEIGGPYGFQGTITRGIVSTLHRQLSDDDNSLLDYIQTDAATNPGNSGGPLLNKYGKTTGIVESIYFHQTRASLPVGPGVFMRIPVPIPSEGIAFAIPAEIVRKVTSDIIADGEVHPGLPGFAFEDNVPPADSIKDKLAPAPVSDGARITNIEAKSEADAMGLQKGDIIIGLDGKRIQSQHDLGLAFYLTHPGERHALSIRRSNENAVVTLTMGGKPVSITAGPPRPKQLAQVTADSTASAAHPH